MHSNPSPASDLRTLVTTFLHELQSRQPDPVTKDELLDHMFGKNRADPEARYLERRLKRTIHSVLRSPENKKAGRYAQPFAPLRDTSPTRPDYPSTKLLSKRARDE